MRLKAFSVVSDVSHPGAERLRRSAVFWGWDHTFILSETDWRPYYYAEQKGQLEALKRFDPEFFIYVDGWDTVFTGPPQELPLAKGKLWLSGDTVLYPELVPVEAFPKVGLDEFPFINCGVMWGDPLILQELAGDYLQNYPRLLNQGYFNHRYLLEKLMGRERLILDSKGEVALTAMLVQLRQLKFNHNRLQYLPTKTMPLVLHSCGAGPTYSEKGLVVPIPKELEELYGK